MKRKALGRGLSALIPAATERPGSPTGVAPGAAAPAASRVASRPYFVCPIELIRPGRSQPRHVFDDSRLAELAASIREQGVLQPLVVRPGPNDTFVLIAGERRWRAAQKAGLHEVPVIIHDASDLQSIEMALVENLQREDLNPVEEAEAFSRLVQEHGYTQERLARRLGRDRSTVANSLRLLKLPEAGRAALAAGTLSAGHARALLGLEDGGLLRQALKVTIERQLSVRQTEALVKQLREAPAGEQPPAAARASAREASSPNVRDLEQRLERSLKTRVQVRASGKRSGRIVISYSSPDELDRLLEVLLG